MYSLRARLLIKSSYNYTSIILKDESNNILYTTMINRTENSKLLEYVQSISNTIIQNNIDHVCVICRGYNKQHIYIILDALQSSGIKIMSIKDTTPIPHNGCLKSRRYINN